MGKQLVTTWKKKWIHSTKSLAYSAKKDVVVVKGGKGGGHHYY